MTDTVVVISVGARYVKISIGSFEKDDEESGGAGAEREIELTYCLVQYADNDPVAMNVNTATSDLGDNLGKPHIPCPDVHPLPILVPNPVKSPAVMGMKIGNTKVEGDDNDEDPNASGKI